jgi:polyhydroxybutyrate depolymerase
MRRLAVLLCSAALVVSCSSADDSASDASIISTSTTETSAAERPFEVFAPSSYSPDAPMPLVVLLHGFGASGAIQEAYFRLEPLAEQRGFLFVHPDGTINALGKRFWNATDACCGFSSTVDDSAYLMSLIEQVQAQFNVDPKRIYLVGHSNGGFMSYRMACEHADTIAAIVSLAGATYLDTDECDPTEPVSVLQIHGTADDTIAFDGGSILGNEFPGALATVTSWAAYNECTGDAIDLPTPLDLEGASTATSRPPRSSQAAPPAEPPSSGPFPAAATSPARHPPSVPRSSTSSSTIPSPDHAGRW